MISETWPDYNITVIMPEAGPFTIEKVRIHLASKQLPGFFVLKMKCIAIVGPIRLMEPELCALYEYIAFVNYGYVAL